ncbi:MAG: hypothetical protein IT320_28180 [Anaerolineae bacterium]|nr:hypothetical protein [Anaerolineae bacterium]
MIEKIAPILRRQQFVPMRVYLGVDEADLEALRRAHRRLRALRPPAEKRRWAPAYRLLR